MIGYEDMTKAWWLTPWHGTDQRHQSAPRGGRRLATPRRGPLADHKMRCLHVGPRLRGMAGAIRACQGDARFLPEQTRDRGPGGLTSARPL